MFEGIFLKNCCTSAQCIFVIAKDYAYILKKCQHKFKVRDSSCRGNRGSIASCPSGVVCNRRLQMARSWFPSRPCQQQCPVEVTLVGDGKARLFYICFRIFFKAICSLIRYRKQLATCWWETYGKEYTFYQLCFSYPLVAFAGCGNRQHSGHCCSEIAFTDQSTRTGCIQPGGTRAPTLQNCTQGWTMYTIFGLDTKNQAKILLQGLAGLVCGFSFFLSFMSVSLFTYLLHSWRSNFIACALFYIS